MAISQQASQAVHGYLQAVEAALQAGRATEHTYRPALKTLLEKLGEGKFTAHNEPKRIDCGAPDYVITMPQSHGSMTVGYVEAKDIGIDLDEVERSPQLKRYRESLANLLLTDYLEFRWFVDSQRRDVTVRLATVTRQGQSIKLIPDPTAMPQLISLLDNFLHHQAEPISKPNDLAVRMARLTHMIRDIIVTSLTQAQGASELLNGWRHAFANVLIADLNQPGKEGEFADMFAQTLAYGLFSARVMDTTKGFTRAEAQRLIPRTNPFLRQLFTQISGPALDDEPFAGFVDDLVSLLDQTDMDAVLENFGKRTRQQDPVVHFYETFLAAYDQSLRDKRGVYYTPEPVVSYIVRSVDHLLRTRFDCADGLADRTKITLTRPTTDARTGQRGPDRAEESHRVLILDPATGTGTFLYSVIDHIRQQFMQRGNAGMWPSYVRDHLLPRLFGFELLMAPYAVAHFKLGLQLAGRDLPTDQRGAWSYNTGDDRHPQRLGVYLTNALELGREAHGEMPLIMHWLSEEAEAANKVKRDLPIMVVMGNPPYSGHSSNKGAWIDGLLKGKLPSGEQVPSYYEVDGQPLGERNSKWLQDDYVKFIRLGQYRIEQTGAGILAFITNHGYLDNPTFRGMRQQLMNTFSEIYILNLHGNSKKKETTLDGGTDQNVFDIQQGVAIGIFVKEKGKSGPATVYHTDLWGMRHDKYKWLLDHDSAVTSWTALIPQEPFYLFSPQNIDMRAEFNEYQPINHIFPVNSTGIVTARDNLTIHWSRGEVLETVKDFAALPSEQARTKYKLGKDVRDWKVSLAQADLKAKEITTEKIVPILYRPFDTRFTYYTGKTRGFICMPRTEVMSHMRQNNLGLITARSNKSNSMNHFFVSKFITEAKTGESTTQSMLFPLYVYPDVSKAKLFDTSGWTSNENARIPNLDPKFVADMAACLGLAFVSDGQGDLDTTFGPEDIFYYAYAVFHAPSYRDRYAEFLKIDFPRLPLTSDPELFRQLVGLGQQLTRLHLMEADRRSLQGFMPRYPVQGSNVVEAKHPRYEQGRVYINATKAKTGQQGQYFEGVPQDVWKFQVGGYQVLDKWLKDRRGRTLSYDDIEQYAYICAALRETIRLMAEIDGHIEARGGWPLN